MDLSHLQGTFGLDASLLVALIVVTLAGSGWLSRGRFAKLLVALRQDPRALDRFYSRSMVAAWILGLSVPLVLLFEPGPTPADVGLRWPAGGGLDYALALLVLIMLVVGGLRRRRFILSGRWPDAARNPVMALLPRTPAQRLLAVGISVTAGVVEEAIFRGLLIAAGVGILGVPVEVAAVPALALFVWGHQYQGGAGLLGAGILGLMFTGVYLISGSILLPVILHTAQDLVALLLVPPSAPSPPSPPSPPDPAVHAGSRDLDRATPSPIRSAAYRPQSQQYPAA